MPAASIFYGRLARRGFLRKNGSLRGNYFRQPYAGSTIMVYQLDQFIADCRTSLKRDPGPAGREQVRTKLEELLRNKDFVDKYCGDQAERGLKVLYEDPELKFQVLAHINDKARTSPPHDHGESWAIYGQATLWTDMIEWKREDDGKDPKHAKLVPEKKYRLNPGHAGIYQDGKIHSIDYPDKSRFVRVTGVNLDNINRIRIDLKTGEVHQMTPQQAT
jgi:predicted metal-dependent enzyme (double-stranded beta helix superfamily)